MASQKVVSITYTDLGGNTTERSIEIRSADDERFSAICHVSHAPRTFRFDRVSAVKSDTGQPIDRDTWIKTVSGNDIPYREPTRKRPVETDGRVSVLFTGLGNALKPYAISLAEEHDLRVVQKSVSARLGYLVTGPTAGPSKLSKARQLGVDVISYEEFLKLIETGEIAVE
ncbi:MAG: BRCT domain-containing protein [Nitrincola lacisaponensis]|uniref:BRCT domain-containing protein n=1 Tax=Nitrincola lacisaponensis TaxID=267850 RepID=UPI00391B011E